MTRTRILTNIVGEDVDYRRGQIVNLDDTEATRLIGAKLAMSEIPSPSGAISVALLSAGLTEVTPSPSGYGFVGPSGTVVSAPVGGGFYFNTDNVITVVFPGIEERFEVLRLMPRAR